jgi:putative endonuclease
MMLLSRFFHRGTGTRGERIAATFLRWHCYRILARNLRTKLGEIDLVAVAPDRRTVVIVEVKARVGFGGDPLPEQHVNRAKQRKLAQLAAQLVKRYRLADRPVRFDVIGVDLPAKGEKRDPVIRHHEAAFESYL